jgi:hypothetical protein
VFELDIAIFVLGSFSGLHHRLKSVPHLFEKASDRFLADSMSLFSSARLPGALCF